MKKMILMLGMLSVVGTCMPKSSLTEKVSNVYNTTIQYCNDNKKKVTVAVMTAALATSGLYYHMNYGIKKSESLGCFEVLRNMLRDLKSGYNKLFGAGTLEMWRDSVENNLNPLELDEDAPSCSVSREEVGEAIKDMINGAKSVFMDVLNKVNADLSTVAVD